MNPQPAEAPAPGRAERAAPAPGMNIAVRAAVRIGLDKGHIMLGIPKASGPHRWRSQEKWIWMSVTRLGTANGRFRLGTNREAP